MIQLNTKEYLNYKVSENVRNNVWYDLRNNVHDNVRNIVSYSVQCNFFSTLSWNIYKNLTNHTKLK